ncbi:MAG: methionyl-tRNA formyltransferase, partial [Betaproteobacteria bacterium]|nr:methionyl-tRNA formyltransferase [Betaproteobacteria bacterium]
AFDPFPGATARHGNDIIKLWRARAAAGHGAPGTVLRADAQGVLVACGVGAIDVTELQRAGGKRLPAAAFLAGMPLAVGSSLHRP